MEAWELRRNFLGGLRALSKAYLGDPIFETEAALVGTAIGDWYYTGVCPEWVKRWPAEQIQEPSIRSIYETLLEIKRPEIPEIEIDDFDGKRWLKAIDWLDFLASETSNRFEGGTEYFRKYLDNWLWPCRDSLPDLDWASSWGPGGAIRLHAKLIENHKAVEKQLQRMMGLFDDCRQYV